MRREGEAPFLSWKPGFRQGFSAKLKSVSTKRTGSRRKRLCIIPFFKMFTGEFQVYVFQVRRPLPPHAGPDLFLDDLFADTTRDQFVRRRAIEDLAAMQDRDTVAQTLRFFHVVS